MQKCKNKNDNLKFKIDKRIQGFESTYRKD